MGKALHRIWHNLEILSQWQRTLVKCALFLIILLFVLFPNPALVIDQIGAYLNTEALFETTFPEMSTINARIDSLLPKDYSFQDEYKTIVRFVYDNIHYKFDWDNWTNAEYWPPASKVWRRGNEDCDGQAILAVAIFRSRGYHNADIVGSMQHLWIRVNGKELMGPDTEKLIIVEEGKKKFSLPSAHHMLEALAGYVSSFPKFRIFIVLVSLLGLLYHPANNLKRLTMLLLVLLAGFSLLIDWAHGVGFYRKMTVNFSLIAGWLFILVSYLFAALSKRAPDTAD